MYDLFSNIVFLFSDELILFVTSQNHQKKCTTQKAIIKNFSQLSVSTGNRLTSDYKRVDETEIAILYC